MFVARDDYENVDTISCPVPGCKHEWCKQCQQSIEFGGTKHSCNGTSELEHLIKQQRWKRCPSEPMPAAAFFLLGSQISSHPFSACNIPIQKISGCDHMLVRWCNIDLVKSAPRLIPTSAVSDSCVQYVSPRLFAIVITMSNGKLFDQALLLQVW
jgi:hypothetical protein